MVYWMQGSMNGCALEGFYESWSYAMDVCIWRVWVTDCISKGANVVMHCMNALRWVHEILWITNGWNDELMIILEPFQRLLWMQGSKCIKRIVMTIWMPKCSMEEQGGTNDTLVK